MYINLTEGIFFLLIFLLSLKFTDEINEINKVGAYLFKLIISSTPLFIIIYLLFFLYNFIAPYLKYFTCLDKIFINQSLDQYKTCVN